VAQQIPHCLIIGIKAEHLGYYSVYCMPVIVSEAVCERLKRLLGKLEKMSVSDGASVNRCWRVAAKVGTG